MLQVGMNNMITVGRSSQSLVVVGSVKDVLELTVASALNVLTRKSLVDLVEKRRHASTKNALVYLPNTVCGLIDLRM